MSAIYLRDALTRDEIAQFIVAQGGTLLHQSNFLGVIGQGRDSISIALDEGETEYLWNEQDWEEEKSVIETILGGKPKTSITIEVNGGWNSYLTEKNFVCQIKKRWNNVCYDDCEGTIVSAINLCE